MHVESAVGLANPKREGKHRCHVVSTRQGFRQGKLFRNITY